MIFTLTDSVAGDGGDDELSDVIIVAPGHDPAIAAVDSDLSFNPMIFLGLLLLILSRVTLAQSLSIVLHFERTITTTESFRALNGP